MNAMTLTAITAAAVSAAAAADLPVRRVVLYKHGVGYFERAGTLAAGQSARLDFKAAEMNDVLKSLTIEDSSGARVTGLRYDSSLPLARKLGEYPFALDKQAPLSAFLDQLKGARLELRSGAETVSGIIVGARRIEPGEKQPERETVTLLLDSGEIRTFDLGGAAGFKLADAALQLQLKEYLEALTAARSRDKRSVYIDSTDKGARTLAASYVTPSAIWKSSYRLLFGAGEPLLEGWAIVDNTTGEDWTNIQLAVVSGRPISFISPLYEPRFRDRPVAELPEDRALAPEVHAGAVAAPAALAAPPPPPAPRMEASRRAFADRMEAKAEAETMRTDMASSIQAAAEGREAGELFEYRFNTPVTVRKNESAMLPFLQQKLTARKLLIYSDEGSENPRNAAEVVNSTGKTLDGGPITVFDTGSYAGEALMETVKAGDKRLISYGLDLGTRVSTLFDSSGAVVREVHLNRGLLTTRSAVQETRTYTIRNIDQKAKTLIIEHAARPGYKLLQQKAAETTASAWRFEVKLAGGETEKFPVLEERLFDNTVAVVNLTPDVLIGFVRNKTLSEEARKQLERMAALKRQIAAADGEIARTTTEINELTRDQERIRHNITSLNRVSGQQVQVEKYARELADQETKLAALRDRQGELRKKKAALEAELNTLIETTAF